MRTVYAILSKAAPKATEAIKWRTPVFEMERILFAFGAFKTHLDFMPTPSVMRAFAKDLAERKTRSGCRPGFRSQARTDSGYTPSAARPRRCIFTAS